MAADGATAGKAGAAGGRGGRASATAGGDGRSPLPIPAFVAEVGQMQADAILLLKFLAGRSDRSMAPNVSPRPEGNGRGVDAARDEYRQRFLEDLSAILHMPAEQLAGQPRQCGFLFAAVDYMSCLAQPATIATIRLTQAYTESHFHPRRDDHEDPSGLRRTARKLKRLIYATGAICIAALVLAIMLMAHVVTGQKAIQLLEAQRGGQSALLEQALSAASLTRPATGQAAAFSLDTSCRTDESGALAVADPALKQLCWQQKDLGVKMGLTYTLLGVWNSATDAFYAIFPIPAWLRSVPDFPETGANAGGITADQWRTTEVRTDMMLTGLSVYGIPVLLGFLGATAYVFRNLNAKLDDFCLEPQDWAQSILRITLGVMLGGLVGLVFDMQGVEFSGMTLSLWFIAFLVGYSVHLVFASFDAIVDGGVRMIRRKFGGSDGPVQQPSPLPQSVDPAPRS